MRSLTISSLLVVTVGVGAFGPNSQATTKRVAHAYAPPPSAVALNDVVAQYCVRCHNDRRMTGNLSFEDFDVAASASEAETAEKMIVKLRAGMMPPPGQRRPSGDTLGTLVETIENLVDAAATEPRPGTRRFQRLTRPEYERVVQDLLGLNVDAGRWLPPDTYLGSFDNFSDAQSLSTTLVESYLRAASEVSRLAFGNANAPRLSAKYSNPIEVSQHAWDHLEGTPYGTRGGMVVAHDFPVDGEYVFEFETLFGRGTGFEDLDVSIDGTGVATLALEHNGRRDAPLRTEPVFVRAGQREIAAAFVRRIEGPYEDRLSPFDWSFVGGEDDTNWANYGITALPHLADLMITGPYVPSGVSATASREKILSCTPTEVSEARACAESIISRLMREAYRRPVSAEDLSGPMAFYDEHSATDGFEAGVRNALQALLASPFFIFRLERVPENLGAGESYRLSDVDLASRLSFFLWATGPDDELLTLAEEGRLSEPAALEAQVRRMLEDPRAAALGTRFAHQWLRLQDAAKNQPEPYLYPDFSSQLRDAMVTETETLFNDLVQRDASLLELFNADYTFLNERLARHYGIPGVAGDHFRRVAYPDDTRKGVLGHGSVLLLTSMSDRTSPVLRGKWVMEVLMGTPPPPPPPSVPALEETEGATAGRRLTTGERMAKHRANPSCNSCHRFIDPIGLALDNFDATGRERTRENGVALDTRGTYYDGTDISSPSELTSVLLKRPIPLVRNFTAHLLAYGIGRNVEYFDQPAIRAIADNAAEQDYALSSFILGVVQSVPFQMRGTQLSTDDSSPGGMR